LRERNIYFDFKAITPFINISLLRSFSQFKLTDLLQGFRCDAAFQKVTDSRNIDSKIVITNSNSNSFPPTYCFLTAYCLLPTAAPALRSCTPLLHSASASASAFSVLAVFIRLNHFCPFLKIKILKRQKCVGNYP